MKEIIAAARGTLFTYWNRWLRKNVSIGPNLKIYKRLLISGDGQLEIGSNCLIEGVKGDRGQFVCIDLHNPNAVIRIGNNVSLFAARISAKFEITIGNETIIEESGIVDTMFHKIDRSREDSNHERYENSKISIGDRVYIGARSVVMKGVTIGDDVVVMPGSVVVHSVKSGLVICGNPAKTLSKEIKYNSEGRV